MSKYLISDEKKVTANRLIEMKRRAEKIAVLTSYDYTTARIVDEAGIDAILIGDSASNVIAGNATTLPITLDQMIYHATCVARGVKRAFVMCDMPFGTYTNVADGVKNSVRVMQESGVDAVKMEGGEQIAETIRQIVQVGIPVMGHLGLTPQSIHKFGTYSVRAKEEEEAKRLFDDALALQQAGCFGITLEKIPAALAAEVTAKLSIPTIGIGAGNVCDGQVLVIDDMLGMNEGFKPKFLRLYAHLHDVMIDAIGSYVTDVKSSDFPNTDEQY